MNSIAPSLVHQESDIIKRTLRDIYDDETKNIIIEGNDGYQKAKNFMKLIMPSHVKKIKKYRDKIPLFIKEKIEKFHVSLRAKKREKVLRSRFHRKGENAPDAPFVEFGGKKTLEEIIKLMDNEGYFSHSDFQQILLDKNPTMIKQLYK